MTWMSNRFNFLFIKPLLPIFYSIISVIVAASYFIYLGMYQKENIISLFGISSTIIFLSIHFSSLGADHSIVSDKNKDGLVKKISKADQLSIDYRVFFPIISIFISFLFLQIIRAIPNNRIISEIFSDLVWHMEIAVIFVLIIFFATLTKVLTSYLITAKYINLANLYYLGKSLGLLSGVIIYELFFNFNILVIFLTMEFFVFCFLFAIYIALLNKIKWSKGMYESKYLLSGFNVFGFDSIMKIDLLVLSFFGSNYEIARYAVLSNVFEGLSQLITSLQIKYASLLREAINTKNIKTSLQKEFRNLLQHTKLISFLFFPAAYIFYSLVFNLPSISIVFLIILFQVTLFFGAAPIVTFFTYSIIKQPLKLLIITFCSLIFNILISVLLYNYLNVYGVILASLITFISLRFTILSKSRLIFQLQN